MWYCEHYKSCNKASPICLGKKGYSPDEVEELMKWSRENEGDNYITGLCEGERVKIMDEFLILVKEKINERNI